MTGDVPAEEDVGRRRYLDLQALARRDKRNTQELLTMFGLEGLLARLARTEHADRLVLKGGMLLAAFDQRRPTRDLDMHAEQLTDDLDVIRDLIVDIAGVPLDDGLVFDLGSVTAEAIREDDEYQGVRVSIAATLHTAQLLPKVDINVGDPVWPAPQQVELPRLLGGEPLRLRGYPLHMVLAEKIVTAVFRGTGSTRWRDFADVHLLAGSNPVDAADLLTAIDRVAEHRGVELFPLGRVLDGFGDIGQAKWDAWRRKQHLEDRLPTQFAEALATATAFADPLLTREVTAGSWDPARRVWVR